MYCQSAKQDYTLEQIQGIRARWISREKFKGMLREYQQALLAQMGKWVRFYERLFSPLMTLDLMLFQRLNADHSCDGAVSALLGSQPADRALAISESNSAYCQARQRLPLAVVQQSLWQAAAGLREELGTAALWHGRQVGLLDGSTLRLEATTALHDHYGVSRNQHGEAHWPIMHLLALFHLFTGGLEGAVEAPYVVGELSMLQPLMQTMDPHWVWVGDMNFGCYRAVQVAHAYEQDVVFRVRPSRVKGWIGTQPMLSGEDRPVRWAPKEARRVEPNLPAPAIEGRLLYLRIEQAGFRPIDLYLFTTLTDPLLFPTQAIFELYARRYNVELNLRHLKTTLQMEALRGKSVDIVRKEVWVGFLAYTLIRGLMGLAAVSAQLSPLGLSFVRCLRRILSAAPRLAAAHTPQLQDAWQTLLIHLARCKLPVRKKARFEPRQVWGKPKVFPAIKGSRNKARAAELAKQSGTLS